MASFSSFPKLRFNDKPLQIKVLDSSVPDGIEIACPYIVSGFWLIASAKLMEDKKISKPHKIPKCDICLSHGREESAVYEAKTIFGPRAFLCQKCFEEVGISLKMGLGRKVV